MHNQAPAILETRRLSLFILGKAASFPQQERLEGRINLSLQLNYIFVANHARICCNLHVLPMEVQRTWEGKFYKYSYQWPHLTAGLEGLTIGHNTSYLSTTYQHIIYHQILCQISHHKFVAAFLVTNTHQPNLKHDA